MRYILCIACGDTAVEARSDLSADQLDGRGGYCDTCCRSGTIVADVEDDVAHVRFIPSGHIYDEREAEP